MWTFQIKILLKDVKSWIFLSFVAAICLFHLSFYDIFQVFQEFQDKVET